MKIFSLVYVVICGVLMLVYEPVIGGCVLAAAALNTCIIIKCRRKNSADHRRSGRVSYAALRAGDRFRSSDRREIMRLVIGGAFQGKKDYVKNTFHLEDGEMQDGASASYEDIFSCPCCIIFISGSGKD